MAREGKVTEETQQQLMRSAQAAGLYTEGANPPLLFLAQAEIPVAPLHARSASLPPKDEYAKAAKADAKHNEAAKEAANEAKAAEESLRAEKEKAWA
jgi:hypothetical protein